MGAERGFDERRSTSYDRLARWTLRGLYRRVAADVAAVAPPGGAVLDVGTGPGRLLHEVAALRPDLELVGADLSPDMVDLARRASAAVPGRGITFIAADVGGLPWAAGSFDVVVSTLSAHHWPDPVAAAGELTRLLRPGGRLIVHDFRFAPLGSLVAALSTRDDLGQVHTGGRAFSLYTRITTARGASPR